MIGRLFRKTRSFVAPTRKMTPSLADDFITVKAPKHFNGFILGRSLTKFSLADRLRILVTGTVVTNWVHKTENEPGKNVYDAYAYVSRAKDWK
jgi:hypothetical protein